MTQLSERVAVEVETSRYAIIALVWALFGLVSPIPYLCPALALWYAETARQHINDHPGRLKGDELAQAARSIAWAALALWIVATALFLAGLAVYAFNS